MRGESHCASAEHQPQNEFCHQRMEMKGLSTREMKRECEKKESVTGQTDMVTGIKTRGSQDE